MRRIASTTRSSNSPLSRIMRPNSWRFLSVAVKPRRRAPRAAHLTSVDVQRLWELRAFWASVNFTWLRGWVQGVVLAYSFALAVSGIGRVVHRRVGQLLAELLVEREEGYLSPLEFLPRAAGPANGAAGCGANKVSPLSSERRGRQLTRSHRTVDVIVGYSVLPFVRRDGNERAAADHTTDLHNGQRIQ